MGYEIGDLVRYGSMFGEVVAAPRDMTAAGRVWARYDGMSPSWCTPDDPSLSHQRPIEVGQRVRYTGADNFVGTVVARDALRFEVRWDRAGGCVAEPDFLVRIADKAEPTKAADITVTTAPTDAWAAPRWVPPACGRPGHDPACLCSTGWVRQPEPEPEVREAWAGPYRNHGGHHLYMGPGPGRERVFCVVVGSGALCDPHPTREGAIALWRARHGS